MIEYEEMGDEEAMDISLENSLISVYRTVCPLCRDTIIMRCC